MSNFRWRFGWNDYDKELQTAMDKHINQLKEEERQRRKMEHTYLYSNNYYTLYIETKKKYEELYMKFEETVFDSQKYAVVDVEDKFIVEKHDTLEIAKEAAKECVRQNPQNTYAIVGIISEFKADIPVVEEVKFNKVEKTD